MKKLLLILSIMTIFLSSCKVSNDVVSKNGISKRKYLKGYHIVGADKSFKMPNFDKKENHQKITKLPVKELIKFENLTAQTGNPNLEEITKDNNIEYFYNSEEIKQQEITFSKKEYKELKSNIKKILKPNFSAENSGDTAALLSLIFGTLGFAAMWFTGIGLLFLITGLILGFVGLKSEEKRNLAVIGLIFSAIGLLIFLAVIVLLAAFLL